jgi:hypothetical protein
MTAPSPAPEPTALHLLLDFIQPELQSNAALILDVLLHAAYQRGRSEGLAAGAIELAEMDCLEDFKNRSSECQRGASMMRQLAVQRLRSLAERSGGGT